MIFKDFAAIDTVEGIRGCNNPSGRSPNGVLVGNSIRLDFRGSLGCCGVR